MGQIAPYLHPGEVVEASGYFRTSLQKRHGGSVISAGRMFWDAARAKGYYLALTRYRLVVVQTRAPATARPLLENKDVTTLELALLHVKLDTSTLLITSGSSVLTLEAALSSKYFGAQTYLVNLLSTRFGSGVLAEDLMRKKQRRFKTIFLVLCLMALFCILWATGAR